MQTTEKSENKPEFSFSLSDSKPLTLQPEKGR